MTRSIRIVHAVRSDGFAGVERYIAQLAVTQAATGHRVRVIGGALEPMRALLEGSGVGHRPAATVGQAARAIDEARACDLLQVHMTAAETAAVLAVRAWPVPVVSTRHFARTRGSSLPSRLMGVLIRRRIAAQIAISDYVAEHIEGSSTVVHSGVPDAADALPAARRDRVVLVAQRLEPEKRTAEAVRIFAASGLADRGWTLDIAGEGSQRPELERLAAEARIAESVRLLGHRADVPARMRSAGLLLATCDLEGLGLTVLEAMAAGTPVVAVAAGGHLETLGGVPEAALYRDEAAATALLAELAEQPERRDQYGRRLQGVQREKFTLAAQAAATEAVYRRVL